MNNKAKTRKAAIAGVVGLTAAGIATAIVLTNDAAADIPDSKAVQRQEPAAAQRYAGPHTADAAAAWLESRQPYTGPQAADAAEAWLESDTAGNDATTSRPIEPVTEHSGITLPCLVTADAAEHWIRATGHLPCEP